MLRESASDNRKTTPPALKEGRAAVKYLFIGALEPDRPELLKRRWAGKGMVILNALALDRRETDMAGNKLKKVRESLLMSRAELAKEADVSPLTIERIERGCPCRMETRRKILLALGYSLGDVKKIFEE